MPRAPSWSDERASCPSAAADRWHTTGSAAPCMNSSGEESAPPIQGGVRGQSLLGSKRSSVRRKVGDSTEKSRTSDKHTHSIVSTTVVFPYAHIDITQKSQLLRFAVSQASVAQPSLGTYLSHQQDAALPAPRRRWLKLKRNLSEARRSESWRPQIWVLPGHHPDAIPHAPHLSHAVKNNNMDTR